ncbi:UNVERIFIED_CONTAM: hypothetical protein RMT77_013660 [Armadillidium vulgare]
MSEYEVSQYPAAVPKPMSPHEDIDDPSSPEYDDDSMPSISELGIEGDPPYRCKICDKEFAIIARLQRHYRTHTGEKPYSCEYCAKTFSVKENLNVHRRIHTKERPYQCNLCNRAFEHSGKLHRHMRTHTGERPHKCELCGKTFVQSGQLVIHMRAHTGEKPYTCDYCQKGFTCSKQLKVHIRTHTGEKPYECDICGKTFGYNHVLKMHKMSHLGEKLYKCTLCEDFFNSRKALDKHIKDHDEDPFASVSSIKDSSKSNLSKDLKKSSRHIVPPCPPALCSIQPPSPYNVREVETSNPPAHKYGPGGITCGPLTPPGSPNYLENTLASHNNPRQELPQTFPYDKYGYKCYEDRWRYSYPSAGYPPYPSGNGFLPGPPPPLPTSHPVDQSQLAFFTTITGERIACPINQVIRIPGPKYDVEPNILHKEYEENKKIREELEDKLRLEELRNQRETNFCQSVLKVLESCIGMERLHKLGYPKSSIDDVIMKTLNLMDTQPCWEPSLAPMDRIKVNLRLLLECCIPDQELWDKFGWKGKSIEDIVSEFLTNPN